MEPRPHWRRGRQLLAGTASVALAMLAFASIATAHSAKPASISVTASNLTIQVSGTWTWKAEPTDPLPSYIGYAMSWGDVTSGNDVGAYHIGDGTSATNVVLQPTTPAQGGSGSFGPVTHAYATAGTYQVCVIMYDLGETKPFPVTGQESLVAGGSSRNKDNSVDNGYDPGAQCATVQVTSPTPTPAATPTPTANATPTPFQSFAGETSVPGPTSTPPPTSTQLPANTSSGSGPAVPLILLAFSSILGVVALKPVRVSRR